MKAVFRSKTYRQPEAGRLRRRHVPPQFRPQRQTERSLGRSAVPPPDGNGLIPRERIQTYCDAIAREFRPRKIVLFGSYAYGQPTPDSDVDLLVVMPFRGNDVAKAIEIRSRFDTPFPLDLIVRKPEFIVRRERERDMFIELLMTEGQVMYESQHA
jgi:predicted nucleotidyltransferase